VYARGVLGFIVFAFLFVRFFVGFFVGFLFYLCGVPALRVVRFVG